MRARDASRADPPIGWRDTVLAVARLLCDCDGRRWDALTPAEQDRYARIAALVDDLIARSRTGPAARDRSGECPPR